MRFLLCCDQVLDNNKDSTCCYTCNTELINLELKTSIK